MKMSDDLLLLAHKFIQFSLTIINLQDKQNYFIYVYEFCSNLRTLSYVFEPIKFFSSNQSNHINIISCLGRPQLLLQFDEKFTYALTILYYCIMIFEIILIRRIYRFIVEKQNDLTFMEENAFFKMGQVIFKYHILIYHYLLIFNILEYVIINISSGSVIIKILNYFIIVMIAIHYCFVIIFLKESLFLSSNKLYDIINTSSMDYFIHILSFLQIIVFKYTDSQYLGIIYESLISLFISSVQILTVKYYHIHSSSKIITLKIIINVIIFSISLQQIVQEYFQVQIIFSYMYIIPVLISLLLENDPKELIKLFDEKQILSTSQLRYLSSRYIQFYQQDKVSKLGLRGQLIHFQLKNLLLLTDQTPSQLHEELVEKIINRYKRNAISLKNKRMDFGAIQVLLQCDQLIDSYQLINAMINQNKQSQYFIERQSRPSYSLSFKDKNYLKVLYIHVRSKINQNMISKPNTKFQNQEDISLAIQEVIHLENTKLSIIQDIQQSVKYKMKILNCLLAGQSNQLFDQAKMSIDFIDQVYNKLKRRYKQFTTIENQKCLLFFQIEILTDYQDAFEISQLNAMEDDMMRYAQSTLIQQLIKSTYYAMITEIVDTKNIIITHATSNINQLINQKLIGKQINVLMPNFALPYHHLFVESFFRTGTNKYFQKLDSLNLQIAPNLNADVEMIMDVNRKQIDSIQVILLLKPKEDSIPTMILNNDFDIQDINWSLLSIIYAHPTKYIAQYFNQIPIQYFIPNIIKNNLNTLQNVYLRIPNLNTLQTQTSRSSMYETWKYKEQCQEVLCAIIVQKNLVGDQIYYKITFSDFNQMKEIPVMILSENVLIDIPYEPTIKQTDQNCTNRESMNLNSFMDAKYTEQLVYNELVPKNNRLPSIQQLDIIDEEEVEVVKEKKHHNFDTLEIGSQISSVGAFKQSQFYKHFVIIHLLASSQKENYMFFRLKLVFILYLLVAVIENALLLNQASKINYLTNDIALLSIKNDVLQPIENFIETRYTIINYQGALASTQINATYYAKLIIFPRSNLGLGYTNAKSSILSVLDLPAFQPFLQDRYFQVSMMGAVNQGYLVKYNFRSVMEQFLIYQYQFWFAYTFTAVDISAPYFYYCYANYLMIYDTFDDLNNFVLQQSQAQSKTLQLQAVSILVPFKFLYCSITIWLLLLYYSYGKVYNKYYDLFTRISKEQINLEFKRLQKLDQQILKSNFISHYDPDVQEKEKELIQTQEQYSSFTEKTQRPRIAGRQNLIGYLVIALTISIAIILSTIVNVTMYEYYQKYSQTIVFYKQIADLGVDIPTMYAQREIIYYAFRIPYLTQSNIEDLKKEILTCINRTVVFSKSVQTYGSSNYLFDSEAMEYLQNITVQNLCNYLSPDIAKKADSFCNQTLGGVLTKGLQITITSMINSLTTEYAINQFGNRVNLPIFELEGVFLASQSIQTLLHQMKANIHSQTINHEQQIILICTVCLVVQTLLTIAIWTLYQKYEHIQYLQLKKLIYLFPQCTLLYDQSFHRDINSLIVQYQIK